MATKPPPKPAPKPPKRPPPRPEKPASVPAAPRSPDAVLPPPALPTKYLTSLVSDLKAHTGFEGERGRAELLGDGAAIRLPGVISSRLASLDAAIGRGGFPQGRITTLTGEEGGGKTTMLLHAIAEVQSLGGLGVLLEKENKLDSSLVSACEVGPGLVFSKPPYLERAFEVIERVIRKVKEIREATGRRVPCLIGVDSIDGFDTKSEIAETGGRDWEKENIAPMPRVMSRNLPRISEMVEEESVALVFIAQERHKIGRVFGKTTEMTGGKALRFHSCLILDITRIGKIKNGIGDKAKPIGSRTRVECIKNQIAAPFGVAEFNIIWGKGADINGDLLEFGAKIGVVEKSGAWFAYKGERIAAGLQNASAILSVNRELAARIRFDVNAAWRAKAAMPLKTARVLEAAEAALDDIADEALDEAVEAAGGEEE